VRLLLLLLLGRVGQRRHRHAMLLLLLLRLPRLLLMIKRAGDVQASGQAQEVCFDTLLCPPRGHAASLWGSLRTSLDGDGRD